MTDSAVVQNFVSGSENLTVRPVNPGDAAGLRALYEGLSFEDSRRRFFSVFHPPPEFFGRLASRGTGADGWGLVAVLKGDKTAERIVGEASYSLLADGDAEFAMTVAKEWRGGLGRFLLGLLAEGAAAHGIPNLQASILTENRPMMTLVRDRGCAVLSNDCVVTRISISTSGGPPSWPGLHEQPRVLLEGLQGAWLAEDAARSAGFELMACSYIRSRPEGCPALRGEPCPLVMGADAIVVTLPPGSLSEALLTSHARLRRDARLFVTWPAASDPATIPGRASLLPITDPSSMIMKLVCSMEHKDHLTRLVPPSTTKMFPVT